MSLLKKVKVNSINNSFKFYFYFFTFLNIGKKSKSKSLELVTKNTDKIKLILADIFKIYLVSRPGSMRIYPYIPVTCFRWSPQTSHWQYLCEIDTFYTAQFNLKYSYLKIKKKEIFFIYSLILIVFFY